MPVYELRLYKTTEWADKFDLVDRITFGAMDDREACDTAPSIEPKAFDECDFAFLWSEDGKALWTIKPKDATA